MFYQKLSLKEYYQHLCDLHMCVCVCVCEVFIFDKLHLFIKSQAQRTSDLIQLLCFLGGEGCLDLRGQRQHQGKGRR